MHPVYEKLIQDIKATDSPVIMFDGYSGTGYADPEAVKIQMRNQVLRAMKDSGTMSADSMRNSTPIYVVAGATSVGIGAVYGVADELKGRGFDVRTVGIVSESANKYPDDIHAGLNYFVDIPDPEGTWQVLKEDGDSYMVDVLKHSSYAKATFMGGGKVAKSELENLERYSAANPVAAANIHIEIRRGGTFAPDPAQVQKQVDKAAAKGQSLAVDDYQFFGTKDFQQGASRGAPVRDAEAPASSPPM